jgi:GAF domain-containing protein
MGDHVEDVRRKNREIRAKYSKIIRKLSDYQEIQALLEGMITEIQIEFGIPYVWITLIRRDDATVLTGILEKSPFLKNRLNLIDEASLLELVPQGRKPVLANDELKPFYRLMPRRKKYLIRSIAVAPISIGGKIVGSLNHGDSSADRYQPEMETSLLEHMAGKLSDRLSELLGPAAATETTQEA